MSEAGGEPTSGRADVDVSSLSFGKKALFSVVLLSVSLAVALFVGELAVRVVAPQQLIVLRPDIWASVDSLGWRHASDLDTQINTGERTVSLRTDTEGFRVGDRGRTVASDSVLLIGDSFMAALQVEHEQSLSGLMEDELRGPAGEAVAVRNAGVGSWNPSHYLIFGRRRLAEHRYGLMLVAVFTGNDVIARKQEYFPPRSAEERPEFRLPLSVSARAWIDGIARPINDALERRSHLFVFLKNRTEPLRIRLGLSPAYIPRGLLRVRADAEDWAVTADVLAELEQSATAAKVPVLFVLIPAQYQVNKELFTAHAAAFGVDTSAVDLEQPNALLLKELRLRGLNVIDALPRFREVHRDGVVLYGSVDSHLSPEGHAVLFELLEEPMRDRLWR